MRIRQSVSVCVRANIVTLFVCGVCGREYFGSGNSDGGKGFDNKKKVPPKAFFDLTIMKRTGIKRV